MPVKKFCVLIPSYNEKATIGGLVRALRGRNLSVYVVDDGSIDDTAQAAEVEGAIIVKHDRNKGKGAAIREGFRHILKKDFEAVLVMDGDGQHRVEDIDNFLKKMEDSAADMVIGNRMSDTSSMPYVRVKTNRFMSDLISKITGQSIPDSQCGFRLIKREVLQDITLNCSNYEIESEMIIKAAHKGFKIESVPIKTIYRDQRSRINPVLDTLRFIVLLIRIALKK